MLLDVSMRATKHPAPKQIIHDYSLHNQVLENISSTKYSIRVCSAYLESPSSNRIEKVQRTAARRTCRRWRNARWAPIARTPGAERRQQASLTFLNKIHNNLVTIDKNRYPSEASRGNKSTRSYPFQYHRPNAQRTGWNVPSSPG